MAKLDEAVFLWANGMVGNVPLFDNVVEWVVSDYLVPVGIALALFGLWFAGAQTSTRQRYQQGVIAAVLAIGFSNAAVFLINNGVFSFYDGYFRTRPFDALEVSLLFYMPTDSSFPSNSVAVMFALAAAAWGVNRKVGSVLIGVATVFGLARVYAGVHYPLDILAAVVIGLVAAMLGFKLRDIALPMTAKAIQVARIFCLA